VPVPTHRPYPYPQAGALFRSVPLVPAICVPASILCLAVSLCNTPTPRSVPTCSTTIGNDESSCIVQHCDPTLCPAAVMCRWPINSHALLLGVWAAFMPRNTSCMHSLAPCYLENNCNPMPVSLPQNAQLFMKWLRVFRHRHQVLWCEFTSKL
jgi:hypothetical protein